MKNGDDIIVVVDAVKLHKNGGVAKYVHSLLGGGGRGIHDNGPSAVIEMCQSARHPQ